MNPKRVRRRYCAAFRGACVDSDPVTLGGIYEIRMISYHNERLNWSMTAMGSVFCASLGSSTVILMQCLHSQVEETVPRVIIPAVQGLGNTMGIFSRSLPRMSYYNLV